MALIFVTLAMGDRGQRRSCTSRRKSKLILLETQSLTDIKGFALASKTFPKTKHIDGRSRDPLGGLRWDQSLSGWCFWRTKVLMDVDECESVCVCVYIFVYICIFIYAYIYLCVSVPLFLWSLDLEHTSLLSFTWYLSLPF